MEPTWGAASRRPSGRPCRMATKFEGLRQATVQVGKSWPRQVGPGLEMNSIEHTCRHVIAYRNQQDME